MCSPLRPLALLILLSRCRSVIGDAPMKRASSQTVRARMDRLLSSPENSLHRPVPHHRLIPRQAERSTPTPPPPPPPRPPPRQAKPPTPPRRVVLFVAVRSQNPDAIAKHADAFARA